MPNTQAALRLTDSYRRQQTVVRDRALALIRKAWSSFSIDEIDTSMEAALPSLVHIVVNAKRENATASPAYLAAFIGLERGEPADPPQAVTDRSLVTETGSPIFEPLAKVPHAIKWAIGNGHTRRDAAAFGLARIVMIASSEIIDAGRTALLEAMQADKRVVAYERVVYGTCGGCLSKQGEQSLKGGALSAHPHCRCITEPVVTGPPPDPKRVKAWTQQPTSLLKKHLANPKLHPQDRAEISAALFKKTGKKGLPAVKRPTGEQLFKKLPKAKQEAAVGKAAAAAVKKGEVKLAQLGKVDGKGVLTQRPLSELRPAHHGGGSAVRATSDWARALWGTKTGPFYSSLSAAELNVATQYSGSYYTTINKYLRKKAAALRAGTTGPRVTQTIERRIEDLQSAIDRLPIDRDIKVTRGTTLSAFNRYHPKTFVGKEITEPGFLSTSTHRLDGFGGYNHAVKMNITAPSGTRALYMEPISVTKREQEILFGRGTRMRVDAVRERKIRGKYGAPDRIEYEVDVTIVGP